LTPLPGIRYVAFVDTSGSGAASMTLAIAHHDRKAGIARAVF